MYREQLAYSGTLRVSDRLEQLRRQGIEVVNFAGGTLDDTPFVGKEATKRAIDDGLGSALTHSAGLFELREAISEKVAVETGILADPATEIMVTIGAKNGILQALQATIEPGDEILIFDPSWPSYEPLARLVRAIPKRVAMRRGTRFELARTDIENEIGLKTRMIILNTPHNPSGRVLTEEEVRSVCDAARKHDLIVLSDECYKEVLYDQNPHYSVASFPGMAERTITVYSFSKAYTMYGWRVGYAMANKEIIERMLTIQSNSVSCPASFAQKGALAVLKGVETKNRVRETYQKLRDIALEELGKTEGLVCDKPQGGFWLFPDLSEITTKTDDLVAYLLKEHRIAVTPGSAFGQNGANHVRICYRHNESYLMAGLKKFKEAISAFAGV